MMKKKKEKKENGERWLLTYSDLITLLMIFFVVLYSISNINKDEYKQLAASLENALGSSGTSADGSVIPKGSGILDGGTGLTSPEIQENGETDNGNSVQDNNGNGSDGISKKEFTKLRTELYNAIKDSDLKDELKITVEDKGMVITLPNDILFDSGEAEVRTEMKPILDKVAQLINRIDSPVQIEGYTDNVPVNNSKYKSNWQLSAERAANVVYYLVDNDSVKPERLEVIAHGENNPVASNKTAKGRMRNRRISITILYNEDTTVNP
ncbi:OmpA family protein [Anaerocolumna sp. AGMB13025]|jgi:chemotaxis protein MotB|uniref:flagellar motor protein MotB n=1 Tax=Anaerocolumna sp. AGMB13025 TaxID=3039116 RepID=UPI00241BEB1C|nr:flagellar motor protein MotB [Anaerocolumna sp. AGMB13025]WFR56076.1 OmpA family protein [Anaerocolumna sp. AGMB13025]